MVMHARKLPRLNDGYYEKGQVHPFEDKSATPKSQGPSGGRYNDKYRGGPGEKGGNSNSWESPGYKHSPAGAKPSPMYQNRSSAMADRTKEKLKVSNNSPADAKRMNHHGHKDRDQRERDHRSEVQKSAVRVFGDWSEHVSSSGKGYFYNCRTEVSQWERPKEWVEAKATEGRSREKDSARAAAAKALHNEQQKHSTSDSRMGTSARPSADQQRMSAHANNNNHRQSQPVFDRQKQHAAANNNGAAAGSKQYSRDSTPRKMPRHSEYDGSFQNHMTACTSAATTTASAMSANRVALNNGGAGRHGRAGDAHRHDQEHRSRWDGNTNPQVPGWSKYGRTNSGGGFVDGNMGDYNCVKPAWQTGRRDDNEDLRQMEDMDISPGSTPTEESMMEQRCASLGQTPSYLSHTPSHHRHPIITRMPSVSPHTPASSAASASVTPTSMAMLQSLSQSNDKLMQKNNQQITQQAIETLQKLQQALLAQQQQQQQRQLKQLLLQQIQQQQQQLQQNLNADSKSPESDGTPLQSPDIDHAPAGNMCMSHKLDDDWSRDSPHSEHSSKSARRDSPTQGHMSISTMLSASHRKPDTVELTPSLANYYDSKLTGHVTGWPGDQVEKQGNKDGIGILEISFNFHGQVDDVIARIKKTKADRLCEEAHNVSSDQCMWVSSELKRARSLVRIAEIQSTLHEQRVLFIQQQIKELESLRSPNTFMTAQPDT